MKTLISIATAVCIFLSIEKKVVAQVIPLKSNKIEKLDKGTSAKGKITKEKIELPPFDEATASAELKEFLKIIRSHRTITAMPNEDTMYRYKVPYNDRVVLTKLFEKIEKPERKYMQYFIWAIIRDYTSEPPTKEQFERYKNPKLYGVWLNDKRVANTELKKYNYSDFANAFASKLYGAAKKGRNYSVQVNMETNEYYKAQQNNRNKKSERDMWTTIKKGTTTNQLL